MIPLENLTYKIEQKDNYDNFWITADTHFYHKNIARLCNRPENHNALMIENWNNLVKEDDLIIHLGDFTFCGGQMTIDLINLLKGNKLLIYGNHDKRRFKKSWFIKNGLITYDYYIINDILFSHKPFDIEEVSNHLNIKINLNIHGHFHSVKDKTFESIKETYPFYNKHYCYCMEDNEYKPSLLTDLLNKRNIYKEI